MLQFPPEVWGPFFWHTIHIVALGYSVEPTYSEKRAAKEFYESLQFLIPCPVCREHYKEHLAKFPITPHLDRRKDLFRWTVVLHNAVNTTLQKPTITEQEALAYYVRLGSRERAVEIECPLSDRTHAERLWHENLQLFFQWLVHADQNQNIECVAIWVLQPSIRAPKDNLPNHAATHFQ